MGQPMMILSEKPKMQSPFDGAEDAGFYFDELREQVGKWSQYNFGDQLPHRPAMGMIEELCELEEELDEHKFLDEAKMFDAVGDVAIYMADYFYRRGWSLRDVWLGRVYSERSDQITTLIKNLAHSHLKSEQNIRGGSERHDAKMRLTCSQVLAFLETCCTARGRDVCSVIQDVWADVGKRDWRKNPNNAHEVAVAVQNIPDVAAQPVTLEQQADEDLKRHLDNVARQSVAEIDAGLGLGVDEVAAVAINPNGLERLSISTDDEKTIPDMKMQPEVVAKDLAEGIGGIVAEAEDYDGRE